MSDIPTELFVDGSGPPQKLNLLLYGPPKSGKSTAAATLPGPILWVNLEGPGALAYPRKTAATLGTEIREVRIAEDEDPREKLRETIRYLRAGSDVQSVVIDTVGKLRNGLAAKMVEQSSRNSLRQWGEVADVIKALVLELRDRHEHVCLVCHEDIDSDEADGRIVRPLIGGKLTEHIMGEVDVIAYCGAARVDDQLVYLGQLVEGRGRRAGDRSGGLGASRPLDLSEWIVAYQEALTPELPWDETPDIDTSDLDTPPAEPGDDELSRIALEVFGEGTVVE